MRIDIITLFPHMFESPFAESIVARAVNKGIVSINYFNLRDAAIDKHKTVDDTPYGGGAGMVLKVDVLDRAIHTVVDHAKAEDPSLTKPHIVLLTPQGRPFKQQIAKDYADQSWLVLICGHYEGFDERIRSLVDDELSIGDYVLTGGELASMVVADAVVRLLPGVLGNVGSSVQESFESGLLEYPNYTRPEVYNDMGVPEILKSGNHAAIEAWRNEQAIERTKSRRPDLLESRD